MKSPIAFKPTLALAVLALCGQIAPVLAQDAAPPTANPGAAVTPTASETRPVQLSSGVPEILKLVRAKVSDTIILSFIKNSGRTYQLSTSQILYLREQGVSDPMLTAMLDQGQTVPVAAAQAAAQAVTTTPASTPSAYVAAAPVYVQPSPVYVYSSPSYGYYDYWPYYGGYHWGYPAWSFSFGYWGGHYGGYHGGGYHGGGGYPGGGHGGGGHPGGHFGPGPSGGGHGGGHR